MVKIGGLQSLGPHSRLHQWKKVTPSEMRAFIAMILYMGMVKIPTYSMYWSNHHYMRLPFCMNLMNRDRFLNILSFFHVCDNEAQPPRDDPTFNPGYKVQALADLLVAKWQANYVLHRELSVDEALVGYKGRIKFLQYMPSKPHKWGMKIWILAESKTGYVYNWNLYTGKMNRDPARGRTATHKLVVDLCEPVLDQGHHVYMDNFFVSPALFNELADRNTGACGTLRLNRTGVPESFSTHVVAKGETYTHREDKMLFVLWKDKRPVSLLTTIHNSSTFTNRIRSRFAEGHYRTVEKPRAIGLYSRYMGGVDLSDQQLSYNQSTHRSVKWWKKVVFSHLLETCVVNARIMYKQRHPNERVDTNTFRLNIISGLLASYTPPAKAFRKPCTNPSNRTLNKEMQHFPSLNPTILASGRRSSPDCEVCSFRPIKRCQTSYWCAKCEKPLCAYPCFTRYHTLEDYKIVCTTDLHKT